MEYMQYVPSGAFDAFIDELDPKEVVEIIKMFGRMSDRIFLGFRANAQAIKAPVVRQRLAKEFETNTDLREVLAKYWMSLYAPLRQSIGDVSRKEISEKIPELIQGVGGLNAYLTLTFDERKGVRKIAESFTLESILTRPGQPDIYPENESSSVHDGDQSEKLRKELKTAKEKISQLQKENRSLQDQIKTLNKSQEKAEKQAAKLNGEILELRRLQADALKRAEHAGRDRDRAIQRVSELDHKVTELRKALDAKPEKPVETPAVPWQEAVNNLLKAKNYQAVLDFLTALVKYTEDDPNPHELLHRVYRLTGQAGLQAEELIWVGKHYLSKGFLTPAADRLSRALVIDPESQAARGSLRSVFSRTDIKNEKRVSDLRKLVFKLKQTHPETCRLFLSLASNVAPALAKLIAQVPSESYADRAFTLNNNGISRIVSPRQIVDAINRNDTDLVSFLRAALKSLRSTNSKTYDCIDSGIRECDESCCITISEVTRPIVVDASNTAFDFRSPGGKPRIKNLVILRRELRMKGFFPIYMVGDAPLPHQADHQSEVMRMVGMGELDLVEPGTDADGYIVDLAKRLNCPIATNDHMEDWDPTGEVEKIRYMIDHDEAVVFER